MNKEQKSEKKVFLKTEIVKEGDKKKLVRKVREVPQYRVMLAGIMNKDLNIPDDEIDMASNMMSGDLYQELRKMQVRILKLVEKEDETEKTVDEIKEEINRAWHDIVEKQKIGLFYTNMLIKKYFKQKKDE